MKSGNRRFDTFHLLARKGRRLDHVVFAQHYAPFIAPLIERIGGISAANFGFFQWRGRAEEEADYRDLFTAQVKASRRVGVPGIFDTGAFLHNKIEWCNPLVTLYAASHLEAFVYFVVRALKLNAFVEDTQRIIKNVRSATFHFQLDRYALPPNHLLPVRENMGSFGAIWCEIATPEDIEPDSLEDDGGFGHLWNTYSPEELRQSSEWRTWFRSRHEARRNCVVKTPGFIDFLNECFRDWYVADHDAGLRLPIELGDLTLAYEATRLIGLHPDLRRYAVDLHLQNFLDRKGWSAEYELSTNQS